VLYRGGATRTFWRWLRFVVFASRSRRRRKPHISPVGLFRYLEQDQREPSLSIAARIARELEIPLDDLASAVTL